MGMTNDGLSFWLAETAGDPLLEKTVGDLLDQRADEIPSHEAVVYSCYPEFGGALDIRWTYRQYREHADEVARGLMALGLSKGDHIAVRAANLPEWLLLQMGAAKAGLVLVTINPAYQASELEYVLKQGDVTALFFMGRIRNHDCLETVSSLVTPGMQYGEVSSERLPVLRYVCLIGVPPSGKAGQEDWRPTLFREMLAGGASVSRDALRERQRSVQPSDAAMIQYTSGTTGFPKGATLAHRSIVNNAIGFAARNETRRDDHTCSAMPFFHVGGCVLAVLGSLYTGATLHPLVAFDPLKILQIISSERCTTMGGVPTMLMAMMQHPQFASFDLSSLYFVVSGGALVPVFLMEQVKERMGADVAIVFGQTEASAGITLTLPEDSFELKSATVGIPMPHIEVKIIDPLSGAVVPCGERGELCCRGYLVMQGYYKMPEVIRLQEGVELTEEDLQAYCNGRISHQKIPRYFMFVDAYPMTASGKVQKFVLREKAIQALALRS